MAIQRVFLIDTIAFEKSLSMISEVHQRTKIPVITGGLVRTVESIEEALSAGAVAITPSNKDLWENFKQ